MEGIRGNSHPLDTPIILECIFKNLSVSDLKTCRQVNKTWHKSATVVMRPQIEVKISDDDDDNLKYFLRRVQNRLSTFSELPFVSDYDLSKIPTCPHKFWAVCGNSVKTLCLSDVKFKSVNDFRHAIFQACPNMTSLSLQDIKIWNTYYNNYNKKRVKEPSVWIPPQFPQNGNLSRLSIDGDMRFCGISFTEIFSHFPSIESLASSDRHNNTSALKALATVRAHDDESWRIKTVSFEFEKGEAFKSSLRVLRKEGKLSLEKIFVTYLYSPESGIALRSVLNAHATTLKELELSGTMAEDAIDADNMIFKKLEILSVHEANLSSTSFLRIAPNLKKLNLDWTHPQPGFAQEFPNDWVVSSCTELTVDLQDFETGDLKQLGRRLPNLEKLEARSCTNAIFAEICEIFPNLVCLQLEQCEVDDTGISGLDKADVRKINIKQGESDRPITVRRPNLSSLQKLKWFRYNSWPGFQWDNAPTIISKILNYCSVLYGVQQLPQLQHLKVEGWNEEHLERVWKPLLERFVWREP